MPRILVVDDSEDDLLFLGEFLTQHHLSFETASSGSMAWEKMKVQSFDLVISDFQMADGDGLWLLSELESISPKPKFILVSSETKFSADHYLSLGADAFVPKPISWDLLESQIKQFMIL